MSLADDKRPVLMLKCIGTENISVTTVAIVEDLLKTVVRDFADIVEDNVINSWMEDSYATKAYSVLEESNFTGSFDEEVERSAIEAERVLSSIMANNHEVLTQFSGAWMVDEVTVLKRLPNLWVVEVIGSRFPF